MFTWWLQKPKVSARCPGARVTAVVSHWIRVLEAEFRSFSKAVKALNH